MTLSIAGMGWVTPLGAGLDEVWSRLLQGEVAEAKPLTNPETGRAHRYAPIPPHLVERLGRQPRLRRASPIAYYSVAAGLAALEQASLTMTPEIAARMAVIFAVSSGSVVYTRRFYEGVVKHGAGSASPLLFPETVYNAPASHLAAQLGIDGYSYTLVGDSSVGLSAMKLAEQLLRADEVDYCLVAGAEEIDWVLCEGYRDWRFGALLAEGAGALLLTRREGPFVAERIHEGISFASRTEAIAATTQVLRDLRDSSAVDFIIGSANGSWTDRVEAAALARTARHIPVYRPKHAMGEALGAGALWQVIIGCQQLARGGAPGSPAGAERVCVLSTGVNQQASGLVLRRG